MVIVLISVIALIVFVVMLVVLTALLRAGHWAGTVQTRPREEPRSAPVDRADIHPSAERGSVSAAGIGILAIVFVVLLLAEILLQSALHKGWTTYSDHAGIGALTVDPQGHVWMVVNDINENGVSLASLVFYPDDGEPVPIPLPDQLAGLPLPDGTSDSVLSLSVDPLGRVWVRTVNGRLAVREINGEWRFFGAETLEGPFVAEIAIDGQGQAWTNSGNLARIVLDAAASTYELVDFGVENVDTITVDTKGQLWVLRTNGDLMTLLPDGNWASSARAPKADPTTEWAFTPFGPGRLLVDKQGQVWIGTGNGILHRLGNDGLWRTYRPDEPHPAIFTDRIVVDGQGYIWGVSGYQGLYRFHPGSGWMAYNARNSAVAITDSVNSLASDGQGRVWIGGYSAELVRFDPAEALPAQYVPPLSVLGATILPAALISIVVLLVWTIRLNRPAALGEQHGRTTWQVAAASFSAGVCGLYALGQRHLLAERFMLAIFGDGWAFGDVLSYFVAPALSICVVPLAAIAGGLTGAGLIRFWIRRAWK